MPYRNISFTMKITVSANSKDMSLYKLLNSTCSRSFLYLCVACWMRSLTVHPSLQGTTTPVCPNVTVTFILAPSTSSKTWSLWMWLMKNDHNKPKGAPQERLDNKAGEWRNAKSKQKKVGLMMSAFNIQIQLEPATWKATLILKVVRSH